MIMGPNGCQGGANKFMCPCVDPESGTKGLCDATMKCKGQTTKGLGGGQEALGMAKSLMDIMKGLTDMLKKPAGGGDSGGAPAAASPALSSGCTQYYQVTTPSSDPCATYVPPVSGSISGGLSSDLLGSLDGSATPDTSVSDLLSNVNNASGASTSPAVTVNPDLSTSTRLASGLRGDIIVNADGATVVGGNRDGANNTEVAGFYGEDNTNDAAPTSIAAHICASRPWAESLVTYILPAAFFDSLCTWRGYTVGMPKPVVTEAPAAPKATPKPAPAATTTPIVDNSGPAGAVKIWAVPASVSVGSRTSVFWNTSSVRECHVTSPDGSFNEKTLSGGASTVPLASATVFSISCIGLDGNPATSSVTVKMAI